MAYHSAMTKLNATHDGVRGMRFAQGKQPDPKGHVLYGSIYRTFRKGKTTGMRLEKWQPGAGKGDYREPIKETFRVENSSVRLT